MGALTDIMERTYQILRQKVGTPQAGQSALVLPTQTILLKSQRYYPRSFDLAKLPLLAATFGTGSNKIEYGHGEVYTVTKTRVITIWAFLNPMISGADGTGETLAIAEPLVDAITECFLARTRLQLSSDSDKLDCLVKDIEMGNDSELVLDEKNIGIISFPFSIQYQVDITRV